MKVSLVDSSGLNITELQGNSVGVEAIDLSLSVDESISTISILLFVLMLREEVAKVSLSLLLLKERPNKLQSDVKVLMYLFELSVFCDVVFKVVEGVSINSALLFSVDIIIAINKIKICLKLNIMMRF